MRTAIKKQGKSVQAYRLGDGNPMEQRLIDEGAIVKRLDGTYELFSQEAVNGIGEIAKAGDYFKVDDKDGKHFPYPNEKTWFEENHRHISGDSYEQIPHPVGFYLLGDEPSPEITQLIDSGLLKIDPSDPNHTFSATLWGTRLSAPQDGAVLIYGTKEDGSVDFNLIQAHEFQRDYREINE